MRCNEKIRISPIRLIDADDNQIGIVDIREAIQKAREAGLDLVEVSPTTKPPVCRIMDYGKWKYAQKKKEQKSKAHRHETKLKEITIKTPKIGEHDLKIKIEHAREFLERGDRVQFTMRMRGRELAHLDLGRQVFEQIKTGLADVAKVDQDSKFEGKRISMVLTHGGTGAKKPVAGPQDGAAAPAAQPQPATTVPAATSLENQAESTDPSPA